MRRLPKCNNPNDAMPKQAVEVVDTPEVVIFSRPDDHGHLRLPI